MDHKNIPVLPIYQTCYLKASYTGLDAVNPGTKN